MCVLGKRIGKEILCLAAAALVCLAGSVPALADAPEVPEDVYQWVQSTARQNYYFNKEQMCYAIEHGKINEHLLVVPTLHTYDDIQIQDVTSKRRWRMEDMTGYDDLVGAAEYLQIDTEAQTVTIVEHDDLDSSWTTIHAETEPTTVKLAELSDRDVDGIFYHKIIEYAEKHHAALLARTEAKVKDGVKDAY